ncbi:hypothetical protein K466DRAFT_666692 [Polyporus arcularius HHB13444]|uniref:F-box domain-containing protein n=1 Tax=Polyporus arcularius HHB13444 TaxID=1314778 RepID=A0A5C3NXS5_9APHY|nr:hypothetical protein K466DRAFT_666692 [Polyporus arcularius HHB13444]
MIVGSDHDEPHALNLALSKQTLRMQQIMAGNTMHLDSQPGKRTNQIRDSSSPPINALPAEVLEIIFSLLVDELSFEDSEIRQTLPGFAKGRTERLGTSSHGQVTTGKWGPRTHLRSLGLRNAFQRTRAVLGRWLGEETAPRTITTPQDPPNYDLVCNVWPISWIAVTWVCQRWRGVALASPALWRTFAIGRDPVEPLWMPVFLERAAGIPLDLAVEGEGLCGGALDLLRSRSARLRGLRLTVVLFDNDVRLTKMLLLDHAEYLERLVIFGIPSFRTDMFELDPPEFTRLKSLEICGSFLPACVANFPSLRSLKITYVLGREEETGILDILRQCSSIEELQVVVFSFDVPDSNPPSPVCLPRLKTLKLTSILVGTGIGQFCEYLSLSPGCGITLMQLPDKDDLLVPIIPLFRTLLHPLRLNHTPRVVLRSDRGEIFVTFSERSNGSCSDVTILAKSASPFRPLPTFSASSMREFADLLRTIQDLTTLVVSNLSAAEGFTTEVCAAALAALPGIATLLIDSDPRSPGALLGHAAVQPFSLALQGVLDGGDIALPVCPLLSAIAISYATVDHELVRELRDMLDVRARLGCKLQVMYFRRTILVDGVDRAHIESMLKEYVGALNVQVEQE